MVFDASITNSTNYRLDRTVLNTKLHYYNYILPTNIIIHQDYLVSYVM